MDSQNFSHSHFSYCKWCCYEQTSQDSAFNSFDSEIQVLNNTIILFLIFCNRHFDLHRSYIILHSHQQNRRVQFSPHTCQYFFVLHCFSVAKSCPTLCNPMDCSPPGFSVHGFPGKNTAVGCHFFLQGIFPTQVSNPSLRRGRRILYTVYLYTFFVVIYKSIKSSM